MASPCYNARYDFLPVQISLYSIRWCNREGEKSRVAVPLTPPSIAITVNLRSLRQFSREVILLVSPFFSIVLGLSRVVNNKPFLLSFGESYVFLVYCGSLASLSGAAAVGLASSHILSLPGAFGSEGSQ